MQSIIVVIGVPLGLDFRFVAELTCAMTQIECVGASSVTEYLRNEMRIAIFLFYHHHQPVFFNSWTQAFLRDHHATLYPQAFCST